MILDNSNAATDKVTEGRPYFKVNKGFAIKMGWFTHDEDGLIPGHNLTPVYYDDKAPAITQSNLNDADLKSDTGEPLLWQETIDTITGEKDIRLSVWCDWHFHNLRESFKVAFFPSPEPMITHEQTHADKTLFVYSDLVKSSLVGNLKLPLLREIKTIGSQPHYMEPHHIHYIPVRNAVIDIVRCYFKLSGTESGDFAEFESGESIVTLHFRQI